jgi:hypothetical protein
MSAYLSKKNRRIVALVLSLMVAAYYGYKQYGTNRSDYKLVAIWFAGIFAISYVCLTQLLRLLPDQPTPKSVDAPDGAGFKPNELTANNTFDALKWVKPLYDDIYAPVYVPRNTAAYSDLLSASDKALVESYNYWNKHYFATDNETMTQAIASEFISFWDTSFRNVRDELVKRLKSLGCN